MLTSYLKLVKLFFVSRFRPVVHGRFGPGCARDGSQIVDAQALPYDTLVLAGSQANIFGMPGARGYCHFIDWAERFTDELRTAIIRCFAASAKHPLDGDHWSRGYYRWLRAVLTCSPNRDPHPTKSISVIRKRKGDAALAHCR
jgi:hypothetical protein